MNDTKQVDKVIEVRAAPWCLAYARQQLIAAECARLGTDRLIDGDYTRIAGWLRARREARRG